MTNKRVINQEKTCPSCGAPIVSEICAYCGMPTGLDTAEANMEYPVLECKEATISFWTLGFPLIFSVTFGMAGISTFVISLFGDGNIMLLLTGLPFLFIGFAATIFALRPILRYLKLKKYGTHIQGTVYGYMDDNVLINDQPAQIVKILIPTSNGPRFILYQLGNTFKLYGIQDKIDLIVYQDVFMICKNKKIYK